MKYIFCFLGVMLSSLIANTQHTTEVTLSIIGEKGKPVAANIKLKNAKGNYLIPDSIYFWKSFMGSSLPDYPSDGRTKYLLPAGDYHYEVDRGPEYFYKRGTFRVGRQPLYVRLQLKRIVDLQKQNWWPGEFHVHRKPEHIERLMQTGDLHVAPVITSWNEHFPVDSKQKDKQVHIHEFDVTRYYSLTGSEDERNGGALLILNNNLPVDFSKGLESDYPPLPKMVDSLRERYRDSMWIDIEKPFWRDLPLLIATGKINSIGIAHNHMNRDGVFDNEGWGRPRDKEKYPAPHGNGLYTQDIYYHLLNTGERVPPSAGSASGVLLNPVGYNRVYAYVENKLTYEKWFDAVAKGKTFVTNGPLLNLRINNCLPGHVFDSDKPMKLDIAGSINNRDTTDRVEFIINGKVIKSIQASKIKKNRIKEYLTMSSSGWIIIRVISDVEKNFRFASTAPFYFQIGTQKTYISQSSAEYFLKLTKDRATEIKVDSPEQRKVIDMYVNRAIEFWLEKINIANSP
jgi:hypothetical protein